MQDAVPREISQARAEAKAANIARSKLEEKLKVQVTLLAKNPDNVGIGFEVDNLKRAIHGQRTIVNRLYNNLAVLLKEAAVTPEGMAAAAAKKNYKKMRRRQ